MFFLFRMAFWLGLILLLVPLSMSGTSGREVGVFEAFGAFQAVVSDASGFCQRQPQACEVGGQMIGHLGEKAQVGAKWLYETIASHADGEGIKSAANNAITTQPATPYALTPSDLAPAWGGGEGIRSFVPGAPAVPASGQRPT